MSYEHTMPFYTRHLSMQSWYLRELRNKYKGWLIEVRTPWTSATCLRPLSVLPTHTLHTHPQTQSLLLQCSELKCLPNLQGMLESPPLVLGNTFIFIFCLSRMEIRTQTLGTPLVFSTHTTHPSTTRILLILSLNNLLNSSAFCLTFCFTALMRCHDHHYSFVSFSDFIKFNMHLLFNRKYL